MKERIKNERVEPTTADWATQKKDTAEESLRAVMLVLWAGLG